jgi:tRNA1(Val) A37 N6-methylase TrmN6
MAAERAGLATSEDAVLGGRLRLRQPLRGHRVGHDAILLAAAVDARGGEHAVELGAGVGAAGLALAARVTGVRVTLVEIDAALAELAAENAGRNGIADRVAAFACDAEDREALAAAGLGIACADRVLMNPPFHDPRRHNVSPDARRRLAHTGDEALLERWIGTAGWLLRPDGVLTLIWRADETEAVLDVLAREFSDIVVLPIAPRAGAGPIRILVRAVWGDGRAPVHLPALILNGADGRPTQAAEAVLRGGQALSLARD